MDMTPVDDQHQTSRLAKEWLAAQLALVASDPAAARAAIDDIERKAAFARQAITETTSGGENTPVPNGVRLNGDGQPLIPPGGNTRTRQHCNPPPSHGLTRNQLTRVRGVYLMEALTAGGGPHILAGLHTKMAAHGFTDEDGDQVSESAIRSHLYRLSEGGEPATTAIKGLYRLTKDGYGHLERERIAYAPLIERFRAGRV